MNKEIDFAKMKVSSQIGDHLGKNMYSTYEKAIDEFLQNAFDAEAKEVSITITEGYIQFKDNGNGFTREDIDSFADIGTESKKGKGLEGNKGIGRFAGWKLGKTITVITRNLKGGNYKFELDRVDFFNNKGFPIYEGDKQELGSIILITGLSEPKYFQDKINLSNLRNDIIRDRALPNRTIILNGMKLTPDQVEYEGGFQKKITHSIRGMWIQGQIGLATKKCLFNGVLIRTGEEYKPVGGARYFGVDKIPKYFPFLDRLRGDISIPSLYDKILSDRDDFAECKEKRIVFDYIKKELTNILDKKIKQVNKYIEEKYEREFNKFLKDMNKLLEEFEKETEIAKREQKKLLDGGYGEGGEEDIRVIKSGKTHHIGEGKGEGEGVEVEDEPIKINRKSKGHLKLDGLNYAVLHESKGSEEKLVIVNHHKLIVIVNIDHPCYKLYRLPKNHFFMGIEILSAIMITSGKYTADEIRNRTDRVMRRLYEVKIESK